MGDDEPTAAEVLASAAAAAADSAPDSAPDSAAGRDLPAPRRRTPAERLFDRIGHRGFSRPRVAVSHRIFEKYRVQDPWDPDAPPEDPIELGPVGLELGKRLEVARHLKPPERKDKRRRRQQAHDPHAFKPRGVPQAKRAPPPQPRQEPPPREVAPTPGAAPTIARTAFGDRIEKQPLRQRIPVRPDLARDDGEGPAEAPKAAPVDRSVPRPRPPAPARGKGRAGRFRMTPAKASTSPVVREIKPEPPPAPEPTATPEPAPPPRRAMPPAGDSLDDLFGMASQGDRIRLGSSRRRTEPAPDEPGSDDD